MSAELDLARTRALDLARWQVSYFLRVGSLIAVATVAWYLPLRHWVPGECAIAYDVFAVGMLVTGIRLTWRGVSLWRRIRRTTS